MNIGWRKKIKMNKGEKETDQVGRGGRQTRRTEGYREERGTGDAAEQRTNI